MIGRLEGSVVAEEPGALTLDVAGVGYEIAVPLGTRGRAPQRDGRIELWVHTVLRSDALELFGFASQVERRVFRLLIAVPNVGPRTALGVLSSLSVVELAAAVRAGDVARLVGVPGIGKKTAERLVLELKGKELLPEGEGQPTDRTLPAEAPGTDAGTRLLRALTNMGYRPAEAERAVQGLGPRVGSEPLGDLLREALARLASGGAPRSGP